MEKAGEAFVAIITGAFIVAIVAVIVSTRGQTPAVIQAGGTALSGIIRAAVGPVMGSNP